MRIGALVPARGGSKRLKKKNIKILKSKPLICWTIDVLLESNIFSDITVSTESDEIIDVVRQYYSSKEINILKRPGELATDDAPLTSVVFHYLENRPEIDWIGLFMPTYPFRKVEKLVEINWVIASGYVWKVVSVIKEEVCLMDYYYPVDGGVKKFFMDPALFCRSNLCAYLLWHRLAVDEGPATSSSLWAKYGLTMTEREYRLHLDPEETIDIDTEEDFKIAEKIAKGAVLKFRKPYIQPYKDWLIVVPDGVEINKLIDYAGEEKFDSLKYPFLVLEDAFPPLGFVRIQDGSIRRYFIRPEGLDLVNSMKLKKTGNSKFINKHFSHSRFYRFLRMRKDNTDSILIGPDSCGVHFGINNETIPWERVIFVEELKKQNFYLDPYEWDLSGDV